MLTRKAMLSSPRLTVFATSHKLQVMMLIGSCCLVQYMNDHIDFVYWHDLLWWWEIQTRSKMSSRFAIMLIVCIDMIWWWWWVIQPGAQIFCKINSTQPRWARGSLWWLGRHWGRVREWGFTIKSTNSAQSYQFSSFFQERKTCPGVRAPAEESVQGGSSSRLSSERGHLAVSMGHVGRGHVGRGGVSFVKTFREKKL